MMMKMRSSRISDVFAKADLRPSLLVVSLSSERCFCHTHGFAVYSSQVMNKMYGNATAPTMTAMYVDARCEQLLSGSGSELT